MVHGPGIGTGGVVRDLEWVIFLRGCICIYILTSRLNSTPSPPVHPFTTAQVFTGYQVDLDCQLLWLREGFFCFVKMGYRRLKTP